MLLFFLQNFPSEEFVVESTDSDVSLTPYMNNENLSSDENLADDLIVDRSFNGHLKLGKKL